MKLSSLKLGVLDDSMCVFTLTCKVKTRNVFLGTLNLLGLIKLLLTTRAPGEFSETVRR